MPEQIKKSDIFESTNAAPNNSADAKGTYTPRNIINFDANQKRFSAANDESRANIVGGINKTLFNNKFDISHEFIVEHRNIFKTTLDIAFKLINTDTAELSEKFEEAAQEKGMSSDEYVLFLMTVAAGLDPIRTLDIQAFKKTYTIAVDRDFHKNLKKASHSADSANQWLSEKIEALVRKGALADIETQHVTRGRPKLGTPHSASRPEKSFSLRLPADIGEEIESFASQRDISPRASLQQISSYLVEMHL